MRSPSPIPATGVRWITRTSPGQIDGSMLPPKTRNRSLPEARNASIAISRRIAFPSAELPSAIFSGALRISSRFSFEGAKKTATSTPQRRAWLEEKLQKGVAA
jgi:hypothetical protein